MRAVVFRTEGLIPIEAFTIHGINSKPKTQSPIGFFGTGLKYAIAVLVREGAVVIVWIGLVKYTFHVQNNDFRGKEFGFVVMRREKFSVAGDRLGRSQLTKLPFTTEYGKSWEMWQAFRELQSNTVDELGDTFLINEDIDQFGYRNAADGLTHIIVQHDKFVDEFHERDKTFLPGALQQREVSAAAEILETSSQHIYFRGLRVADLQKPTMFTYNVLRALDLTEDRTVKYDHQVQMAVAQTVATSQDEAFIEKIITAPKESWESDLSFDYLSQPPSEAFKNVMLRRSNAANRSARGYYHGIGGGYVAHLTSWELFPTPWRANLTGIYDAAGKHILSASYGMDPGRFKQLCQDVADLVNEAQEAQHQESSEPAIEAGDSEIVVHSAPSIEDDPF
jgi:hypothetical protein